MWRKLTSAFMSVVLVVGLCPGLAYAESGSVQAASANLTAQDEAVDPLQEIAYGGDNAGFYKADLTSPFGMLSVVDDYTLSFSDGKVHLHWEPSNKTVYGGFYIKASIEDESTRKDENWIPIADGGLIDFSIDKSYCGYAWPVVPVKRKDGGTTAAQYYLAIPPLEKIPGYEAPADEPTVYDLAVSNDEKMFKVVKATLEDAADGQDYLTLYLSGSSYGWMFAGGQDEAVSTFADKETNAKWAEALGSVEFDSAVNYGTYDGGTATATSGVGFKVPVTVPADERKFSFDIVAYASDFSARNFSIDLDVLTLKAGSASDVASLTVKSSVADVTASAVGTIDYTGYVRPYAGNQAASGYCLSNDFVGSLQINLGDNATYDKAYAVTYQGQPWLKADAVVNEPVDADYADIAANGALELPIVNEYDTNPKTAQLNGNKITVKMHVAESAPYKEAGQWVERTFQLDFTSRTAATLAISGDALTSIPVTLEDGIYLLPAMKSSSATDSQMFNHMESDSRLLKVDGDTATILFTQDGSTASVGKYSRLALGKSSELVKSAYQPDADLPEGTVIIEGVEKDKTADNARWSFEVPLEKSKVEQMLANRDVLYITVWNNVGSSKEKVPGWYQASSDLWIDLGTLGAKTNAQSVSLVATDAKTGAAINGAAVTVTDAETGAAVEPADGKYGLTIGSSYKVTATVDGYRSFSETYTAKAGEAIRALKVYPLNYYHWMQVRGTKPIAEQTYSLHGKGEVVTIKAASDSEATVVPSPEGTYYVLDNLKAGETYTVTVTAPEGYAVVTEREWSVEEHGYVNETEGETTWTYTFPVTDEKEFLGNLIVYFVEYSPQTGADFTAVDKALGKVPANLKLFTDETAAPVSAAVAAVNRGETDQAKVDDMAAAIEVAIAGLVPQDGRYEVTFDKANSTPYYVYDGLGVSEKAYGMGVLVVEGGKMSLEAVVKGGSYAQAYLGTKDEAIAAAPDETTGPEGMIVLTENADNATNRNVVLPVGKFNTQIQYAYHSSNSTRYNMQQGWYDHGLIFRANSLKALGAEDESIIDLSIYDEELMFKVVNAYIEKGEAGAELVFCLSAKGYEYVYVGTYDEAVADLEAIKVAYPDKATSGKLAYYSPATVSCVYETMSGKQDDGTAEKYQFRIPLADLPTGGTVRVPITAISDTRANAALELEGDAAAAKWAEALTARQALIDLDAKTVRTGNYQDTLEASVTSSMETMPVVEAGSIYTVGTPQANEYTIQPTFTVTGGAYDKAFKGTAEEAAAAGSGAIDAAADGSFSIRFQNSLGKTPEMDVSTWQATVAFHVAADAAYAEAGTWVERTITVNPAAKTISLSGDELTAKGPDVLADGTYKATKVTTDVTTDASGMIMVTEATVVVKDGQASALVTMKGTGADRLYVSDTATKDTIVAEAVAEEKKEVGGEEGGLIGGLKLEDSSAYSFWPIPITLGAPTVYAARSASHFSKQDLAPEKYYYVHDFQIDEADLERVSDSTDLPVTPQQEAQRYLNQYFLDGKVVTSATAASVTGKNDKVTIPYYDGADKKISSVVMKMANAGYKTGWFFDKSILSKTYFSSSNLKKIQYPQGSNGTVTFSPTIAKRDEGMTVKATLRLYPADTNYNQYDADGVYFDKDPLAEQEFAFTVEPLPGDRKVTIEVVDAVSGEVVPNAVVSVTKDSDNSAVELADGTYTMAVPGTYTVKAQAEGYLVPGTEDAVLAQESYAPKKDGEKLTLKLVKAEQSKSTVAFDLKDQMGDAVQGANLTVYRWDDSAKTPIAAEEDGSYRLYYGVRYGYNVEAEGYETLERKSVLVSGDATEEVLVNKYLSEQRFTFRVYDSKTNETLEGVKLVVKYGPASADPDTYSAAEPDENGVYTIPIDNKVIAYGSKTGYESGELGVFSLGFDPLKDCSFGLKALPDADYTAVNAAKAKAEALDRSAYTAESLKAVDDAVAAVAEGKKSDEQAAVDAMAKAIEDAIAALVAVEAPADLSKAVVTLSADTFTFNGKDQRPTVAKVVLDGTELKADDYEAVFPEAGKSVDAQEYTVVVRPKDEAKFTGSASASYTIAPKVIAVPQAVTGLTYTGSKLTGVKKGTGYTVSGNTGTDAKSYTAKATASKNYRFANGKGSVDVAWKIAPASIANKAVTLSWTSKKFNNKVQVPTVSKVNGKALRLKTDYTVTYSNKSSKAAGSYKVTVKGAGNYTGTAKAATYKIAKAANTMTAKANNQTVKLANLKKGNQTIAASKAFKVTKAQGLVSYAKSKKDKNKTVSVDAKGKVTIKKGTKKGTYKVLVDVTAKGDNNHDKATKTVTLQIKVQ